MPPAPTGTSPPTAPSHSPKAPRSRATSSNRARAEQRRKPEDHEEDDRPDPHRRGLPGARLLRLRRSQPRNYKAEVEPICERNTKANEKTLQNVKEGGKAGQAAPRLPRLHEGRQGLKEHPRRTRSVTPPEADPGTISKWLGQIKTEIGYFEAVSKKLRAGQQERRREDGDQADPQRRTRQRHGARL